MSAVDVPLVHSPEHHDMKQEIHQEHGQDHSDQHMPPAKPSPCRRQCIQQGDGNMLSRKAVWTGQMVLGKGIAMRNDRLAEETGYQRPSGRHIEPMAERQKRIGPAVRQIGLGCTMRKPVEGVAAQDCGHHDDQCNRTETGNMAHAFPRNSAYGKECQYHLDAIGGRDTAIKDRQSAPTDSGGPAICRRSIRHAPTQDQQRRDTSDRETFRTGRQEPRV